MSDALAVITILGLAGVVFGLSMSDDNKYKGSVLILGLIMFFVGGFALLAVENKEAELNAVGKIAEYYKVAEDKVVVDNILCINDDCDTWEATYTVVDPHQDVNASGIVKFSTDAVIIVEDTERR